MSKAVQNLKNTLQKQLATAQKFVDNEFPPEAPAVLGPAYSKYYLHRASDIFKRLTVLPNELNPNDLEEGLLKDGYFLSAVATLAEDPFMIRRLFLTEEPNKVGLYAVWLCDSGNWKPVVVDDFIPCNKRSGAYFPLFAQSANDELWISILEKAYAKIYGSYTNLEGGSVHHALRDLTGAPVEEFHSDGDTERTWNFILNGAENEYFMACATEPTQESDEGVETKANILACTILDAREVEAAGGAQKLILLRNPWKSFEWKGEWSNESQVWTADLRNELKYQQEDADAGLFWIKVEDFEKYFPLIWVCKYKPNNKYYSVDLNNHKNDYHVIRIHVPEKQEVTISLNQKDKRCFNSAGTDEKYTYSYARLLLGKVFENEGLGYITGNASEKDRNLQISQVLKAGTYILTAEVHWNQDFCKDLNISFYSDGELEIESVPEPDLLTIQKSIILSSIEKEEKSRKIKTYAKYGDANIEKTEGSIHGLLYFYYVNDTKKESKLTEKITFSTLDHIIACPPYTDTNQVEVTVMPDHEVLVLYKAFRADHAWAYFTSSKIQPLGPHEDPNHVPQEIYDYIDEDQRRAPLELNEDYNVYIQEGHDLDYEEDADEPERSAWDSTISKGTDRYDPEEKKSNWSKSSPTKPRPSKKGKFEKDYPPLRMEIGQTNSKKITYENHDDYDKDLNVVSSDPKIIYVKTPQIRVRGGESADVRLRFFAPKKVGTYHVRIDVKGKSSLEETLNFTIENVEAL